MSPTVPVKDGYTTDRVGVDGLGRISGSTTRPAHVLRRLSGDLSVTGLGWFTDRSGDPLDVKDMDPHYKHEHVPGHPDNPWARDMWGNPTDRAVKHFDDETREAHRLFVDGDGNLRRASDGSLFDTQRGVTHWSRNEGGGRTWRQNHRLDGPERALRATDDPQRPSAR